MLLFKYLKVYITYLISTLGWHQNEHVLTNLNCGREYHVYVVLFNALGASPASQVLTTRTLGNRPTAPTSSYDFILANTTFLRYVVLMFVCLFHFLSFFERTESALSK